MMGGRVDHDMAAGIEGSPARARPRGRPTDPQLERRILDAARHRLAISGYARTTIAEVAADAGVSRPTVYKRWPTKADLITAALQYSMVSEEVSRQNVADLPAREAIRTVLRTMAKVVASPEGIGLIGSVLVEDTHTPGLFDLVRKHIVEPGHAELVTVLEQAQRDDVLRPDLDLDSLVAMLYGAVLVVYLRQGLIDDGLTDRILDAIWPAMGHRSA
jgi:AcrR family transcriptional regulator